MVERLRQLGPDEEAEVVDPAALVSAWCCVLIGVCQAHGTLQALRIMKLHIDIDVLREAPSEEMGLLVQSEAAGVCHSRLEGLLIRCDVGQERQMSQLGQVVGVEGRPEALVA